MNCPCEAISNEKIAHVRYVGREREKKKFRLSVLREIVTVAVQTVILIQRRYPQKVSVSFLKSLKCKSWTMT